VQVIAGPVRPTSRGTITLKSSDPYEYPVIDPNYLDTKTDIEDTRSSVRIARQVGRINGLAMLNLILDNDHFVSCMKTNILAIKM